MGLITRIVDLASARGKDLAQLYPALQNREHLASFRSDAVDSSEGKSYLGALGDYTSHVWVRRAVTVLTNNFASLPVKVMRDDKEVPGHPLTTLLTTVNPKMTSADLWSQWLIDMLLGGEEGWELVKAGNKYGEIWPRQPHVIGVRPDPARRRYFDVLAYVMDDGEGEPYSLPPEEFVHFKFFNPLNPWRGLSVIGALRASIVLDIFAQSWAKLFYKNSARPDYAVIAPAGITPTEREDLELQLATKFGGDNAYKPIVLEQGITDLKTFSFAPKDLEWLEQRNMSRSEIAAVFGVPDEIMGYGRDTFENFETAHEVLWVLTILPLASFRDTNVTEYFRRVGTLKENESVVTDTSKVAALKKGLGEKVTMFGTLVDRGVPVNTANQFLDLGLPEIENGDVGYISSSMVPLGTPPSGPAVPLGLAARSTRAKGRRSPRAVPAYGSDEHKKAWDDLVRRQTPWERRFGRVVGNLFENQRDEVLRKLREGAKGLKAEGDVVDDPFDMDKWNEEFMSTVHPVLSDAVAEFGQAALDDLALGMAFDVLDPAVVEFLTLREQRFAEAVNETTWTSLKDSLNEGLDAGESIPDLEKRVTEIMADRIRSSAETIARTEIVGASNGGTLLAWDRSGVVARKSWLAALDPRTRETHISAHGQTVDLMEEFAVGAGSGLAPGQIGLAEEDINCRCGMIAELAE